MLETIRRINSSPLDGIKFHQLRFSEYPWRALPGEQVQGPYPGGYLEILCSQLEILRPDIVVHRLLAEATEDDVLLAPHWRSSRALFSQLVEKELINRGLTRAKNIKAPPLREMKKDRTGDS